MNPFFNNGQQQLPPQQPQHHLHQQHPQAQQQQQQQPPRAQAHQLPIMNGTQLLELVNSISPNEKIDPTVKQALIKLAESFVLDVTSKSADLARHRHSKAIEQRDIALYLEREWDMTFPPSASSSARLNNSSSSTTAASAETVQQRQIQRNIAVTHAIGTKSSTRMTPSSSHISRNSQATRIANSAAALLHSTNGTPPPPSSSGGASNNSHKYRN